MHSPLQNAPPQQVLVRRQAVGQADSQTPSLQLMAPEPKGSLSQLPSSLQGHPALPLGHSDLWQNWPRLMSSTISSVHS